MPFKLFSKKKKPPEDLSVHKFLCILLVDDRVQAALWHVVDKKIEMIQQSVIQQYENNDDGLIKIDQALQQLGPESEGISDVVFGFDPSWIGPSGLRKTQKPFVKDLTQSLQLKPMGFVVVTDALVQQRLSEVSLDSSVLIYVQEKQVYILLIKQGKLVQQISVGRSDDVVNDIVEGLARFSQNNKDEDGYLPAKVILTSLTMDPGELKETQQAVINYNWAENHPFLQAPLVETLDSPAVLRAVVQQGGAAIASSKGLEVEGQGPGVDMEEQRQAEANSDKSDENVGVSEMELSGDNFEEINPNDEKATSFGIPLSEDKLLDSQELAERDEQAVETAKLAAKEERKARKAKQMPKWLAWFVNHPHRNVMVMGVVGGILALLATLFFGAYKNYQVEINLTPEQKTLSKDMVITLNAAIKESDPENLILKASKETKEVSGKDVLATTGIKLVGEKATGKVKISNKVTSEKTFSKGTTFAAQGKLFELDEEVTVAAASVEEVPGGEEKTYGTAEVNVTAKEIGAEGNLEKDTELTIESFDLDTYSANVVESFTGGASREIRVVAQSDRDTLLKTLKQDLDKKGIQEFEDASGDGTYYVSTGQSSVVLSEFNAEVGEEVDELSLDLVLEVEATAYQAEDIKPLVVVALKEDVPEGYELLDEDPEILSSPGKEASDSSTAVIEANVRTKAQAVLQLEELKREILDKELPDVSAWLQQKDDIAKVEVKIKPVYFQWLFKKLPKDQERIILKQASN